MNNDPAGFKPSFKEISSYFQKEIDQVGRMLKYPFSNEILSSFENYQLFIRRINKDADPLKEILIASDDTRILSVESKSEYLWEVFTIAHIAACCELMKGTGIPRQELDAQSLSKVMQQFLSSLQFAPEKKLNSVANKLHYMDAIRTMHLLRALGLITKPTAEFHQLGLGAGDGYKDLFSLHKLPVIRSMQIDGKNTLVFDMLKENVSHIVLSDMDPHFSELYKKLNEQNELPVLAINKGTNDVLNKLKDLDIRKRNLVTSIRFDHRMIPDVVEFFKLLTPIVDDQCDLVMSMGAGNTPEEFEGRINLMKSLFDELNNAKLQPVLIKLHGSGTLLQQHKSLAFGNPWSSTYEILYCSLNKKQLIEKYA